MKEDLDYITESMGRASTAWQWWKEKGWDEEERLAAMHSDAKRILELLENLTEKQEGL